MNEQHREAQPAELPNSIITKRPQRSIQVKLPMPKRKGPTRVLTMGAAGRDFHNFSIIYRDDPESRVIALPGEPSVAL